MHHVQTVPFIVPYCVPTAPLYFFLVPTAPLYLFLVPTASLYLFLVPTSPLYVSSCPTVPQIVCSWKQVPSVPNCAGNSVEGSTGEPDFLSGVKNMTVPEGRDVTLSCSVKNLGSHKVRLWAMYHLDLPDLTGSANKKITKWICTELIVLS